MSSRPTVVLDTNLQILSENPSEVYFGRAFRWFHDAALPDMVHEDDTRVLTHQIARGYEGEWWVRIWRCRLDQSEGEWATIGGQMKPISEGVARFVMDWAELPCGKRVTPEQLREFKRCPIGKTCHLCAPPPEDGIRRLVVE